MLNCRTGKIIFYSTKDAKSAIQQQKAARKPTRYPSKHYYACEHCEGYHLTSKSKRQVKLNMKLKNLRSANMAYTTTLREEGTVTWFLANPVKWMWLEIVNDATVVAHYDVEGVAKHVVLRNE